MKAFRLPPGLRFLPAILLIAAAPLLGQPSAANYTFATTTSGSLTDMSSGTTQLVAASQDDTQSAVANIGFDLYFGGVRYTQFSATSNGLLVLGGATGMGAVYSMAGATPWMSPALGDDRTTASGKVHFKVLGSAPSRTLVVEWLNLRSYFSSTGETPDLTFQARISETTGVIEFVYGSMTMGAAGAAYGDSASPQIGFSWGAAAGSVGAITAPQAAEPTFDGTGAVPVDNTYAAGAITSLTSAANGSRRTMTMTPATPGAPGGPMTFTAVTPTSMTLNWTDSPNELGYAVYRSLDGGVTYSFVTLLAANTTSYPVTGLVASTPYTWLVYAYAEGLAGLTGTQSTLAPGPVASTATGGNWSDPATWAGGVVPTANDAVTIAAGATVTIDTTAAVAYSVTVAGSGALVYQASAAATLTVGADVTIQAGGSFQSAATGTVLTHSLVVGGNLTNDGTLDFSTNGDTAAAVITFTGPQNATFSGSGATTDIRQITINKGTTPASVLEVMPASFTVRGVTTDTVVGGWLVMTNGTIEVSGTFTMTSRVFAIAAYIIPASSGFWLNNPNFTVAGQNGSPTNNGRLRITQGTFNVGTSTGNSMGFGAGCTVTVEGGAVNTAGRFGVAAAANAITYVQTAGTITVCTAGNASGSLASFDMGNGAGSSVTISGGTIVVQLANTNATPFRDYRHQAGTAGIATVTGGTLQLGNASSGAAKAFSVAGVLPNFAITNASGNHTATFAAPAVFNNISLDITVNAGNTLNFGNNVFLFDGTTITNNGTITHTGASSRFIFFRPGTANVYTGAGTVTAPMTSLELQDDIGLTIDPASPNIVVSRVILFTGGITNANKITLGNGGATTGTIQIGNTTTPTNAGLFDVNPTFNLGTGGQVISYLRTTAARTTGPEVNPARSITNVTYDDNDVTHFLTIAGGDLTVTGTATMTNGRIVTGANTLAIGSAGTVTRTNGFVDGNLKKNFTAAASKTFEVGTANGYSPVTFNATAGSFPADATVKATDGVEPGVVPAATALNRFWTLTSPGFTADLTFAYLVSDVPGTANEANFKLFRNDAGTFTDVGATISTAAHTASITGVTTFSNWTLAEQIAPIPTATVSGDATICEGTSTTIQAVLTGNGPWNLTWSDNFAQPGVATSPATRLVSPASTAVYTVNSVSDAFYASGTMSGSATVTVNPRPATPVAGNNGPVCEGSTLNLIASSVPGAVSYAWVGPNSFTSTAQNPSIASATAAASGTYSVVVTDGIGCISLAGTTAAIVAAAPTTPTPTNDGPACSGSTLHLFTPAVTGGTYVWTGPNGFSSSAQNPTIPSVTTAATGTYSVTVMVGSCTSAVGTTSAVVNQTPDTPTASNDGPLCAGAALHLTTPTVAGATYLWTDPNGFTTTTQNPTFTNAQPDLSGTYHVTITVSGCTSAAGATTVAVNAIPATPTAANDGPVCEGATLHLTTPAVTGATYAWTGPNGFTSATQNPSITSATPAATGTYSLTVTVSGCTSPVGTTSATVNADTTAPVVTAPGSFTVDQSLCCGTFGGASGATSTGLNNFINGGSATDDCMATPTRLTPQISGVDVTSATCFEVGTTSVTFRYQDDAGHTGTASSNVTVRMFGDLDMNHVTDPSDMVIMRAYFNFVVTPGTAPFNAPLNMADLTHNTIVDPADMVVLRAYFNFVVSCLAP